MGGGTTAVVIACLAALCLAHPIHTTLTNVTYDRTTAQVTAMVRAFAADVDLAVARRRDTAVADYLRSAIALTDRSGRPVPLTWCGERREADAVWLCVRAPAPQGLGGMMMTDRLLFEVFTDQVNIVMTEHGCMLFTNGDSPRRLP